MNCGLRAGSAGVSPALLQRFETCNVRLRRKGAGETPALPGAIRN